MTVVGDEANMDMVVADEMPNPPRDVGPTTDTSQLDTFHLLDLPVRSPNKSFDRLTRLAERCLAAPIALVVLVDQDRQWCASAFGLDETDAPMRQALLSHRLFQHVVTLNEPFHIEDARILPHVLEGAVVFEDNVVACLCTPLRTSSEQVVGSLCVMDIVPRKWTDPDVEALNDLAALVMTEIEQHQTNEALRESEARFRVLVQRAVEGVTILRADGTVIYQSDSIQRTLGYDAHAFIGENVFTRIHPDDLSMVMDVFSHLVGDPDVRPVLQFRFLHADGSWRWFEARGCNLLADPAVRGIVISASDITDRIRMEQSLRESEERFRSAFDDAATGQALVGIDGRFVRVNASLCQMIGYSPDELVGRHFFDITHPDDVAISRSMRHHMDDTNDSTVAFEKRYVHKSGRVVWVQIVSSVVGDTEGHPLYLVTQVQDITDLKQAQAEAIAEIARREEFLSIAAHELKTPITSIKASSQILARLLGMDIVDPERLRRLVAQHHGQVGRLEHLVSDLLDVSRIHRGRLELRPEPVDLGSLSDEVAERFRHAPEHTSSHRLIVETRETVIGEWDRSRLDQVLTNLVSNALKYSPNGGDVVITVKRESDDAVVRVQDQGIGIREEMLAEIFMPFARREYLVPVMYGTGLGLYITRQIVEHHGGMISVESLVGSGSTFTVRLPCTIIVRS